MNPRRRPMGALEGAVLTVIWKHPAGLTPGQVADELDDDLAYTTVMTILTRLWRKDLLHRSRSGRAFLYRSAVSEDELAARRIGEVLRPVEDRAAALACFVDTLSSEEADALRQLLDEK